ncbi:unnamed protein product [Cyprideis torosa]|uniref:Uncharacterized protein n=1 Tax=Cyprideis torosa TaxID=163714 RepID=A0A7R8WAZ3_9CRUS|nr:unnamed protein product [Cyprideis torosa]CAG0891652.1 unnamed protein product [Cyprideis torosa]
MRQSGAACTGGSQLKTCVEALNASQGNHSSSASGTELQTLSGLEVESPTAAGKSLSQGPPTGRDSEGPTLRSSPDSVSAMAWVAMPLPRSSQRDVSPASFLSWLLPQGVSRRLSTMPSLFAYGLVFSLASCAYLNSLSCDFVFDDVSAIKENKDLRPHVHWSSLWANDFWGTPMTKEQSHKSYRPLCVLTFRWNYLIHQLDPLGYHCVNLLLHGFVCVLYLRRCTVNEIVEDGLHVVVPPSIARSLSDSRVFSTCNCNGPLDQVPIAPSRPDRIIQNSEPVASS